jgi:hypothetical protein
MKKLLILFLLISSFGFSQNVSVTLAKADIVDINRSIKQDMVQDSVVSAEKVAAAKSCEDALKRAANRQTVTVPIRYVVSCLSSLSYSYYTVESQMRAYRKFLRIVKQLAVTDPSLGFLSASTSSGMFGILNETQINTIKEQIKANLE